MILQCLWLCIAGSLRELRDPDLCWKHWQQ